jgi:hypothetical protein
LKVGEQHTSQEPHVALEAGKGKKAISVNWKKCNIQTKI